MNSLPNEILLNTFCHFSQRYIVTILSTVCKRWNSIIIQPWLFSTIHIYNKQQLGKFVQMAKEGILINNKHINYYVTRLIFHYEDLLAVDNINAQSVFLNLQQIDGLTNYNVVYENKYIYIELQKPTKFSYCPKDEQWLTKFNDVKYNLKSLEIYISEDEDADDEIVDIVKKKKQEQNTLSKMIYLKIIGQVKINASIPKVMLILPSLTNLIELKIDFLCYTINIEWYHANYIIDQHTFENIYQSCPLLESLSFINFYLDISDDYNEKYKNDILPAKHLKTLNMMKGEIYSPNFFSYIAIKYPQLESLSLCLDFYNSSLEEKKECYQNTILNMLLQFPLLKKLSLLRMIRPSVWPYYEIYKWLNLNTNQLVDLTYSYPITKNKAEELTKYCYAHINTNGITLPVQHQFNYLHHLAYLSMDLDNITDFAITFLLENENATTTVVSAILKELNILFSSHFNDKIKCINIYDWLDMFPNILLFSISNSDNVYMTDHSNFMNDYDELHQLIQKRKQQLYHDSLNKTDTNRSIYKLKSLKLSYTRIWFKNGFDTFLKKCHQLNTLKLDHIRFINSMDSHNEIQLDMSHLHLKLLILNRISFALSNNIKEEITITKYIIHESLIDVNRVIERDMYWNENQKAVLNLKCKFIDGLVQTLY